MGVGRWGGGGEGGGGGVGDGQEKAAKAKGKDFGRKRGPGQARPDEQRRQADQMRPAVVADGYETPLLRSTIPNPVPARLHVNNYSYVQDTAPSPGSEDGEEEGGERSLQAGLGGTRWLSSALAYIHSLALFTFKIFCKIKIIAFLFIFDKYCPIMN